METSDLLPHRTALIGAAVAMVVGLSGGLALKTGSQTAPQAETFFSPTGSDAQVESIAWPAGKVADYVIGTDFLRAQRAEPPVVIASYEPPEYVPTAWTEPTPQAQPVRLAQTDERTWPSTGGDILNTRLPEDAPPAAEPPRAPEPPQAIEAPDAPRAPEPVTMAAAY